MYKNILFILVFMLFISGCTDPGLDKQQYYDKGNSFMEAGNLNGAVIAFKKAIEKDQNYFEARYQLARAYISQGKYESAGKELLKVLKLNPSFHDARLSLAKVYLHKGNAESAIHETELYLRKKDDDPEAHEIAALAHASMKDYGKAQEILNRSVSLYPKRVEPKIILADIHIVNNRLKEAEALLNEVLAADAENTRALYLLTRIRHRQNDFEDLVEIYETILELHPDDHNARFELGFSYLRLNDLEAAKRIADQLRSSAGDRPEGNYLTGLIYFNKKDFDNAVIYLQKSTKKAAIPGAHYYLGLSHLSRGDLEQATSAFRRVLDLRPDIIQARLMIALTYLRKGRLENAEYEAEKALEEDEQNAFAHNLLGSVYLALGRTDEAMNEFDRAIELNPGLVDAHIKKGAFSLLSGDAAGAEKEFTEAVEIAPGVLNSRIVLARYYIKKGKYQKAIRTLKEGLKEHPDDAILYNIMGAAYLGAEDTDSAVAYFNKAIKANPDFFLPYFNLALLHLKANETEKALRECKRVLDIDSGNVSALLMSARIMENDRKYKEALSYYIRAREQGDMSAYLSLAGYYRRRGNESEALREIEEALKSDPDNLRALDMQGSLYAASRKYEEALAAYRKMEDAFPETGLSRQAEVYTAKGDYDRAIMKWEELLRRRPDDTGILIAISDLYVKKGDFRNAEKNAKKIISDRPESIPGYKVLASVYVAQKQYDRAVSVLQEAENMKPDSPEITLDKGKVYLSAGNYDRAMDVFREIERAHPEYVSAHFFQANVYEITGRKKEAARKHREVLDLSPDYVPSLNNLAYLYTEGYGPYEEAVEMARRARELRPRDGRIIDTLGWTLYNTGDYDSALKYFIEATHYLPGEPTVRYHLGLVYAKKGMKKEAEEQLKNAVRLGRGTPFEKMAEARKMLEDISRQ